MPHEELLALLKRARVVLDRYLIDEETEAMRDDIAGVMLAINDVMPNENCIAIRQSAELPRALDKAVA